MGKWLLKKYQDSQYIILFDKESGKLIRQGTDNVEPFWNVVGPELLDVSITNYCEKMCDFCYRASNRDGTFMSLDDYRIIIEQAADIGVLQIALGGGNPNQHPDFIKILELTRKANIIPSYTTNGEGMLQNIYKATKEYCGALAVSWYYPYKGAIDVINTCKEMGIKVNVHFLLNKDTIKDAIYLLEKREDLLRNINAIVFLNYKPIHSSRTLSLKYSEEVSVFIDKVLKVKACKIGFDSCMISFLVSNSDDFYSETTEFCESARFSAFISEDLKLYPCSFYKDIDREGIDLRNIRVQDGWKNGKEFIEMRNRLRLRANQAYPIKKCMECAKYETCHGGCQIFDINACKEIYDGVLE
ncbi:radical SAM protein [Pectinatus haikarae]|uniref:radical SAM protein n=1 Tax=Pectinatus haikarae TaxID=349096 RepID=UPI0018C4726A|nr:radical SAM protein [Pectinatus haikarae]